MILRSQSWHKVQEEDVSVKDEMTNPMLPPRKERSEGGLLFTLNDLKAGN